MQNMPKLYPSYSKETDVELDHLRHLTDDEEFRLSRVNLEKYRADNAVCIHWIAYPWFQMLQWNFSRTVSRFTRRVGWGWAQFVHMLYSLSLVRNSCKYVFLCTLHLKPTNMYISLLHLQIVYEICIYFSLSLSFSLSPSLLSGSDTWIGFTYSSERIFYLLER